MKIKITNREIFFAVESVWNELDYKLKYQLNQLVSLNDTDSFEQEVEINAESFIKVMKAASSQPQGVAKDINPPMHLSLKNQILTIAAPILEYLSTLTDEQERNDYKAEHIEILTISEAVQSILVSNEDTLNAKILNGKTQILS
jgi:hypothetical protein